jgi:hypothetical protein
MESGTSTDLHRLGFLGSNNVVRLSFNSEVS